MEVAGCRLDLDLKTGTTGAEQGRPAPEVSTKEPLPKKPSYHHHHHYTITTFTLYDKGNFEFSWSVDVNFFSLSLHLYSVTYRRLSSFVYLWVSLVTVLTRLVTVLLPNSRSECREINFALSLVVTAHTHTHTHIYIYICNIRRVSDTLVQSTTSNSLGCLFCLCSFSWLFRVY